MRKEGVMARSDLLINLVKSGATGDKQALRKTVEAIVAEERAKQHNVLADQIEKAYRSVNVNGSDVSKNTVFSEHSSRTRDFIVEVKPRRRIEDLVLQEETLVAVQQLIEEQQRASLLRSYSLEPRNSALLIGPPGNGKTSLAEAIAESLAVPFFVVRYESMIGSFLGETASRMKRVFDFARTTPCVLFFDEFDTVGKERGDTHETGEIKRVVTSLLMQIDDLPSYVVILAATNHSELLDRAVWRRFQLRLSMPVPTQKQIASYLIALSERSDIDLGVGTSQVAKTLGRVSFSEAEQFFLNVARRQVLAAGEKSRLEIAKEQLRLWSSRVSNSLTKEQIDNAGTPPS